MEIIINSPDNPVFFHIFSYPVRYYGVILSIAILAGIFLSDYLIKLKYDKKTLEYFQDSIPIGFIFALFGARLFYVTGSYEYYLQNPSEIIMINHGGISIFGAIVFGILAIYIYSKIKKISSLKYLDFYALVFPISQAIGRFGNYFNQEAYGSPSHSFLKLYIDKAHRIEEFINIPYYHPTFLYEAILDLIIFILLLFIYKKTNFKEGTIFYIYLLAYSFIRLIVESIRIDSILNIGEIKIVQIIAILFILISTFFLFKLYKKRG